MIQADPLCGHFPKKTKAAGRHGPILKKEVTMTGYYDSGWSGGHPVLKRATRVANN